MYVKFKNGFIFSSDEFICEHIKFTSTAIAKYENHLKFLLQFTYSEFTAKLQFAKQVIMSNN